MDIKAGIVTGSIGVCSRQAPTVTRANGNVRGAAYLASPQLQCFSSSREWISCQLAAPPPTRCWDNLHFEARRGFEWLLVPGLLCGIVRRQRLVPCLANLAGNWLSRRLSSPTLLLAPKPRLLSSLLRCFEHATLTYRLG